MPGTDKIALQQNNSEHKKKSPNDAESLDGAHIQAEKAIKKDPDGDKKPYPGAGINEEEIARFEGRK